MMFETLCLCCKGVYPDARCTNRLAGVEIASEILTVGLFLMLVCRVWERVAAMVALIVGEKNLVFFWQRSCLLLPLPSRPEDVLSLR